MIVAMLIMILMMMFRQVDSPAYRASLFLLELLPGEKYPNLLFDIKNCWNGNTVKCGTTQQHHYNLLYERWTVGLAMIGKFQIACR